MSRNYNVTEIAQLLDVNIETVRRWIRKDALAAEQPSRKEGNVITGEALHQFLKSNAKYEERALRNGYAKSIKVSVKAAENAPVKYAAESLSAARGRNRKPGIQGLFSDVPASRRHPDSPTNRVVSAGNVEAIGLKEKELIAMVNTQQKELNYLRRKKRSSVDRIRRSLHKKR